MDGAAIRSKILLREKPSSGVKDYLWRLGLYGMDVEAVGSAIRSDAAVRALEARWYASLSAGKPDYGVYDEDVYFADLWQCWVEYSRKFLLAIGEPKSMPPSGVVEDIGAVRRVADLGCGLGYTTAALRALFYPAEVVGTNLKGTKQWAFNEAMAKDYQFKIAAGIQSIGGTAEVVFASEYFEHIQEPITHLDAVLSILRPRVMIIANAFGAKAIGHFDKYIIGGKRVSGKEASSAFGTRMKQAGFVNVKTGLWNQRPAYYKRGAV